MDIFEKNYNLFILKDDNLDEATAECPTITPPPTQNEGMDTTWIQGDDLDEAKGPTKTLTTGQNGEMDINEVNLQYF